MKGYFGKVVKDEDMINGLSVRQTKLCFESILKLWEHHSNLPNGVQPFQRFDSIFRVIERLDPDNDELYFFLNSRRKESQDELIDDVQKWLQMAEDIDQVARVWLEYVFKQAALSVVDDNTEEWLELSEGFSQDGDASFWSRYFYKLNFRRAKTNSVLVQA
ncbi:hypothetical protein G5B47_22905 [Paenibacillus sp. 7124]|uniref:Uncharacterized protein n=1 Tax=Paenibacillus apii TaxID=1850370 RepID=A0A6M1PNH1_9BACL|nr:hypothetical protein [Paenibacillus apii]NGM85257.1 hypothetical protein [Paenibacillus apii]